MPQRYVKSADGQKTYLVSGNQYIEVDDATKEVKPGGTTFPIQDETRAKLTGLEDINNAHTHILDGTATTPEVVGSRSKNWNKGETHSAADSNRNASVTTNTNEQQFADFQQDPAYKQLVVGRGIYDATRGLLRAMYGQDIGDSNVDKYLNETRNKYEGANNAYSRDSVVVSGTPGSQDTQSSDSYNSGGGQGVVLAQPSQSIDLRAASFGDTFGGTFVYNAKEKGWSSLGPVKAPDGSFMWDEVDKIANNPSDPDYKAARKLQTVRYTAGRITLDDKDAKFLNRVGGGLGLRGRNTGYASEK